MIWYDYNYVSTHNYMDTVKHHGIIAMVVQHTYSMLNVVQSWLEHVHGCTYIHVGHKV